MADIGQNLPDLKAAVERRHAAMDQRLAAIDEQLAALAPIRAQLDRLPSLNRALSIIQQDVRAARATFNDYALRKPTGGQIEALHFDLNRVQTENAELALKVATLERLVRELQER